MIAIVLVNYNGSSDTIECIDSLLRSSYSDMRIVVVDNNSTDGSLKDLKQYVDNDKVIIIAAKENNGFSAGNNIGIQWALDNDAEYIWLLNNDTIVEPNTIDLLLLALEKHHSYGVASGKILYEKERTKVWYGGGDFNDKTAKATHLRYRALDSEVIEPIQEVSFASGCCMCIKADVIRKIGFMNEDYFLYEEDADYCIRIRKAGYAIVYQPSARIYHKISSSTGEDSPMKQYYSIRNKYMLIRDHISPQNKMIAYCYTTIRILYYSIKKRNGLSCFFKALNAFFHHETGKRIAAL